MPRVTVLQLDTRFPRPPGDIGSEQSFTEPPQILRVPGAGVAQVVTDRPETLDIAPFEAAVARAEGDVIATSCGFLSFWQDRLAAASARPFVASALGQLPGLAARYTPEELVIVTYDAERLTAAHLAGCAAYESSVVGLPPSGHLRAVIGGDEPRLDQARAAAELVACVQATRGARTRAILLECTNLPPYKAALRRAFGLPIFDILTAVEAAAPGSIQPQHL